MAKPSNAMMTDVGNAGAPASNAARVGQCTKQHGFDAHLNHWTIVDR